MYFKRTGWFVTAVAALFIAASANAETIVYQDSFDGDEYGTNAGIGGGLEYRGGLYRDWLEDENGIYFTSGGNGGTHSNLSTSTTNSFDLSAGFRLEVNYTVTSNTNSAARFVMGLMDADLFPAFQAGPAPNIISTGDGPKAAGLLGEDPPTSYGIGFAPYTTNQLNGLTFANGTTTTEIDQSQLRTNGTHALVLEMDDSSNWSYSIDGVTATNGTIDGEGFDYTRKYCFATKAQKIEARISDVTLTSYADAVVMGDADGDGDVDAADYIMVKKHFGGAPAAGTDGSGGDFDGDGMVDWDDLQTLMEGLNGGTAGAPVPEPATMIMLAAGLPMLLKRRRS